VTSPALQRNRAVLRDDLDVVRAAGERLVLHHGTPDLRRQLPVRCVFFLLVSRGLGLAAVPPVDFVLSGGAWDALSCCPQSTPKLPSSKTCVSSVLATVFFIYSPHYDVPDFDGLRDPLDGRKMD
jgi:hypothetical protein